ncbi:MAG: restriction endonuclease subunit S [Bacteroides sp.]|nr:restriction endonuclease subunit S [Bacteroides sp.]
MKTYPEYKASGIDWLGDMPSHWKVSRLKHYISISNGSDPSLEGDIPVYGTGELPFKTCGEFKEGPTVLLGRKGSIDTPHWVDGKYWNVDTAFDTKVIGNYNIRYFWYIASIIDINPYKSTTAVPSMTQSAYDNMPIPVPSIGEQEAIAAYLDDVIGNVDTLILEKQKQVENLRSYRTSLITETVTHGLNPNAPCCPSGIDWLGDIPEHWKTTKLKYITSKIGSGVTPKGGSEVYSDEGILFIRSQNVYPNGLHLDDPKYISKQIDETMCNTRVYQGDILLNITGASIGRCCVYSLPENANVNQHVCIIRPLPDTINNMFLCYVINSNIGQEQIAMYQTGGNREGLNFEQLKNFTIPLPSFSEQQAIAEFLDEKTEKIDALIGELEKQLEELAEYKKAVISEAVTGKVDVRDWKPQN